MQGRIGLIVQFKYSTLLFFAIVAMLNLVGCGTTSAPQTAGLSQQDEGSAAQMVSLRAQQRWAALLKRDMDVAYQFISPAGRSLMSLDDYRPRSNTGFWRGAKVSDAVCAAETCEVTVLVDMVVEGVKFNVPIKETWILDAGKWWFVYQG